MKEFGTGVTTKSHSNKDSTPALVPTWPRSPRDPSQTRVEVNKSSQREGKTLKKPRPVMKTRGGGEHAMNQGTTATCLHHLLGWVGGEMLSSLFMLHRFFYLLVVVVVFVSDTATPTGPRNSPAVLTTHTFLVSIIGSAKRGLAVDGRLCCASSE